ncbi:MAG: hypothetical protein ACI37Z_05220 [Candidatus Gastranaerophilaceae bacterium]
MKIQNKLSFKVGDTFYVLQHKIANRLSSLKFPKFSEKELPLRQELYNFCEYKIVCQGCPLNKDFSCGRGVHFLNKENGKYSMSNRTIRKAYKTLVKSSAYKKFKNN